MSQPLFKPSVTACGRSCYTDSVAGLKWTFGQVPQKRLGSPLLRAELGPAPSPYVDGLNPRIRNVTVLKTEP